MSSALAQDHVGEKGQPLFAVGIAAPPGAYESFIAGPMWALIWVTAALGASCGVCSIASSITSASGNA